MGNSTRIVVPLLCALVAGALLWWILSSDPDPSVPESEGASSTIDEPAKDPSVVLRGRDTEDPDARVSEPDADVSPIPLSDMTVEVFGRVEDEMDQPVAGAEVLVTYGSVRLVSGTSADDGSYRLSVVVPEAEAPVRALVTARDAGRMDCAPVTLAVHARYAAQRARDLGEVWPLTLRAEHRLEVVVRADRDVTGPVRLRVDVEQFSGVPLLDREVVLGVSALIGPLPPDRYRLTAASEGFARGAAGAVLPRDDDAPVEIRLGDEHVIAVRVLDADGDAPIEGARIEVLESVAWRFGNILGAYVPPLDVAPTDASGCTEARGLTAVDRHYLKVHADGYEQPHPRLRGAAVVRLKPGEAEAVFRLKRLRTVRWPLLEGEVGVPPEGSAIRLVPPSWPQAALPVEGYVEAGHLVVEGLGPESSSMLAIAPGGSLARVNVPREDQTPKEVEFVPARTLEVRLRYPDGSPASGFSVSVSCGGYGPSKGKLDTNEDGVAFFEGLLPADVRVQVADAPVPWGGRQIGIVDLSTADGHLTHTMQREREVVVHVTVDGEPRLPVGHRVKVNGIPLDAAADPGGATVRGAWRPHEETAEARVGVECKGFLPATKLIRATDPAPHVVHLDLVSAGSLVLRATLPEDKRSGLHLQHWDATTGKWTSGGLHSGIVGAGQTLRIDASGTARVDGLAAGRYRIVDTYSLKATEAVEVSAGGAPAQVHLDLSKTGWVLGTILGPDGKPVSGAGVRIVAGVGDVAATLHAQPRRSREDGTFAIRVPGDRDVTIEAVHALHRAAAEGGRVTLREPQEGVVLRLEAGAVTTLTFDVDLARSVGVQDGDRLEVRLYRGAVEGDPVLVLQAPFEGRTIRFGGYEPGTYTLWVDANPRAPVVLSGVELGAGETAIGPIATSSGGTILLKVIPREGRPTPWVRVFVWSMEEPRYGRQIHEKEQTEIRLSGLGPGRHEVTVTGVVAPGAFREEVEITGTETHEFTIDLR